MPICSGDSNPAPHHGQTLPNRQRIAHRSAMTLQINLRVYDLSKKTGRRAGARFCSIQAGINSSPTHPGQQGEGKRIGHKGRQRPGTDKAQKFTTRRVREKGGAVRGLEHRAL